MKPSKLEIECINIARAFYSKPKKSFFKKLFGSSEPKFDATSCIVSKIKTFNQLWSDFGLRDYGINYLERGVFSYADKRTCLIKWCSLLYPDQINISELEELLIQKNVEKRKAFAITNPGGRMITAHPLDEIPELIDEIYGAYTSNKQSNSDNFSLKRSIQMELGENLFKLAEHELANNPMKNTPFIGSLIHQILALKSEEVKHMLKSGDYPISNNEIDVLVDEVTTSVLNQILEY